MELVGDHEPEEDTIDSVHEDVIEALPLELLGHLVDAQLGTDRSRRRRHHVLHPCRRRERRSHSIDRAQKHPIIIDNWDWEAHLAQR
jgi:hypothetical protein